MKKILLIMSVIIALPSWSQKAFQIGSPDGKIEVNIRIGKAIEYSIRHDNDIIIDKSPISMTLSDGRSFGTDTKLIDSSTKTIDQVIKTPNYKKSEVIDNYNEITFRFKENYQAVFRAYNDGVAYRFISNLKGEYFIDDEQAIFNLPTARTAYIPYVRSGQHKWKHIPESERNESRFTEQFGNSFENTYEVTPFNQWKRGVLAFAPLVVEVGNNKKIGITDVDLFGYPGMFLYKDDIGMALKGVFAPYPKAVRQGGNMLQDIVTARESYIAKVNGPKEFPWRTIIIAEKDYELANNDMVYKLAKPSQISDISWIKPGKVAWEWWNDWNLRGVDFKSGINNDTYKYYIDFAAKHGIEYVLLDEGWSVREKFDLFHVVPEVNLEELVQYGKERNVGLILWSGYFPFKKDVEGICKHYAKMGIKGFKVDFFDRDDQPMTEFQEEVARIAAKYKLLIDFHGTFKPAGLQRTYPNSINFEGVYGLEMLKFFEDEDMVTNDVTIPFTRMLAGPIDYTQGAMRNATKGNFRAINSEAMSQGTRCRQLAEYVVFESPLNMLCDAPTNYERELECTAFITHIPTVWDETIALNGEIGKYISIARRKNDTWYVGGLTNWDERQLTLDLSFIGNGKYKAEIFKDGINADRIACDYKKETIDIPDNRQVSIHMAPGGGYAIRIFKAD